MTKTQVALVIIFLVLNLLILVAAEAQEDCYWEGGTVSDETVPLPNTHHCNEVLDVSISCDVVTLTAHQHGWFMVAYYGNANYPSNYLNLVAGQVATTTVPEGVEYIFIWVGTDIKGVLDVATCSATPIVSDGRVAGVADHLVAIYPYGDYVQVYLPTGELVLQFEVTTELPLCVGNICVYLLDTGEYQINIEGDKLIEIISTDITFTEVEVYESD